MEARLKIPPKRNVFFYDTTNVKELELWLLGHFSEMDRGVLFYLSHKDDNIRSFVTKIETGGLSGNRMGTGGALTATPKRRSTNSMI